MREVTPALRKRYGFIVCGAGSAGCAVAGRLARTLDAHVLLVEAGPLVRSPATDVSRLWPTNVGSDRDWGFRSEPEPALGDRIVDYSMGRLVGGGSSVNASVWARGHKADWDRLALAARDPAWGYDAILALYRRIEDYAGDRDAHYHGRGGPIGVGPSLAVGDIPSAGASPALGRSFIDAAAGLGIPVFAEQNGALQEAATGVGVTDLAICGTHRSSLIDGYLAPALGGGRLDLATDTLVTRIVMTSGRAVGVDILHDGETRFIEAGCEVIVAGGAIQTPKLLQQSGIGDRRPLREAGIDCVVPLPGVGQNLQDHPLVSLAWKAPSRAPVSASAQAVAFLDCAAHGTAPDAYLLATEIPSPGSGPEDGISWAIGAALLTPESRGRVSVVDGDPHRAPLIRADYLSAGDDLAILERALAIAGEIGASDAMKGVATVPLGAPGTGPDAARNYIRANMRSGWHLCGTCRMGDDDLAVVDGALRVHGALSLRICDTSILPHVTRGNTMAPAIVIGERMSDILASQYA